MATTTLVPAPARAARGACHVPVGRNRAAAPTTAHSAPAGRIGSRLNVSASPAFAVRIARAATIGPNRRAIGLGRCAPVVAQAAAGSGGSGVQQKEGGHAVMHDFCMSIPFGAFSALGGIVALFFKGGGLAAACAGVGVLVSAMAAFSLMAWRKGGQATLFTGTSAVATGGLAYALFKARAASPFSITSGMAAISGVMCVFLLYNIVAGGNPPKTGNH